MAKKKNKAPTIEDKINEIKRVIILNHPDGFDTEDKIDELLRLQKAKCEMNKEIDINVSDVIKEYPIGEAVVVKRIKQGWLFECRNGFMTFVPHNVASVSGMLADVATLIENGKDKDVEGEFIAAVSYVFQAPIFSSLSIPILFENATQILKGFNSYCKENYSDVTEAPEVTEEQLKEDAEQENITQAFENME